jgi:hypothetical protein
MKKNKLRKGQKILYLAIDFLETQNIVEVFYIEEYSDGSGRFYLTTNDTKVNTFNQENYIHLPGDEILVGHDYRYIKNYSKRKCDKYIRLLKFLLKNEDAYNNATKYFVFRDDYKELYSNYGNNSLLFNNLMFCPIFFYFRFWFNVSWKYLLGTLKRIFSLLLFFKDLVKFLYEDYYNYKCAKNELKNYISESRSLVMRMSVTEAQKKEDIEKMEKNVFESKEIYSKSNISFFTFVISIIAILVSTIFFTVNLTKKDDTISYLQKENRNLSEELNRMRTEKDKINENMANETQNEINNKLILNLNELTNILHILKENNQISETSHNNQNE